MSKITHRREPRPAFQTYAADELSDAIEMTLEQIGARLVLRSHAWREGSIPADHTALARILRVAAEKFAELWPAIEKSVEDGDIGRFVFPDLEELRREYEEHSQKQRDRANRRWKKDDTEEHATAYATALPRQCTTTPTPTPTPTITTTSTLTSTTPPPSGGAGGGDDHVAVLDLLARESGGQVDTTKCGKAHKAELVMRPIEDWTTIAKYVGAGNLSWMNEPPGVAYLIQNFDALLEKAKKDRGRANGRPTVKTTDWGEPGEVKF